MATATLCFERSRDREYRIFSNSASGRWCHLMSGELGLTAIFGSRWPVAKPVPIIQHGDTWTTYPLILQDSTDLNIYPRLRTDWHGVSMDRWVAHVYLRPDNSLTNRFDWQWNDSLESRPLPCLKITTSHWTVMMITGVLPTLCAFSVFLCRMRAKHARESDCVACGYNLTGNTSGICPECGCAIPATSPADPPRIGTSSHPISDRS
jgi:hypothetical protein